MNISEITKFINQNSGIFSLIFSGMVAFSTMVYAILTWKLVAETRKMREAQTEPKISITIQPREEWINLIDMVIQNIGLGPAYDIQFKVKPDFKLIGNKSLSELGFIKNGLKYLAPNQKIQFFLTNISENFEEKIKSSFEIEVTYRNSVGKLYKDIYLIDFSLLIGLLQLGISPIYKIATNIEDIKRDINSIQQDIHKLSETLKCKSLKDPQMLEDQEKHKVKRD